MLVEESIKSAVSSIKTNGVRSFLTALAIIIGTAAVITVIGIGSSAEKALEEVLMILVLELYQYFQVNEKEVVFLKDLIP
ncbi:MAG: hypothetical protein CM15mP76_02610 [Prochlorococcus sp.]|nr:MAG: hypothetical protein CM15mP76_02610 [Prochlorococcus sp.]